MFLAVSGSTFHNLGHTLALYQKLGPARKLELRSSRNLINHLRPSHLALGMDTHMHTQANISKSRTKVLLRNQAVAGTPGLKTNISLLLKYYIFPMQTNSLKNFQNIFAILKEMVKSIDKM